MARAFCSALSVQDPQKTVRSGVFYYKIVSMVIAVLTALAALAGLAVSVSLLTLGMRPLRDVVALWTADSNAHAQVDSTAASPAERPGAVGDAQLDMPTNVFVGIVGFFLSVLGIPDTIQVVVSVELLYGAWHERADMVLQWIKFTQKTTAVHAAFVLLVVIALFAVGQNVLSILIFGSLLLAFLFMACLVAMVHRFHYLLLCRTSPIVIFQTLRAESTEE